MSALSDILLKLAGNPIECFDETTRLLVKIADNVIRDPTKPQYRTLQKMNATISKKILSVPGGTECLLHMGFEETEQQFSLPMSVPLNKLVLIKTEIAKLKMDPNAPATPTTSAGAIPKSSTSPQLATVPKTIPKVTFKQVKLPPFDSIFSNRFLQIIEKTFHMVLTYEDEKLQERSKSIIPVLELETKAQTKLRTLQEQVKREKLPAPNVDLQDMIILELLNWFKTEFFSWVDSPACKSCGCDSKYSHQCTDKNLLVYTNRVEMHKCTVCSELTPFPRYDDPNILLETRKGRCGEWANVFTLFCRTMGWDSRYVMDETDHVWTEVYSHSQKRWLHCDPCENACDTPLIYEVGWGKKLSYIIAYSAEELQDVTWRYSCEHKSVLKRRTKCSEEELIKAMMTLREQRQKSLTQSRRDYLAKRLLGELLELMVERKPNDKEQSGRLSGSLAWKLSRGETNDVSSDASYTWLVDVTNGSDCVIRYSTSKDAYEQLDMKGNVVKVVKSWHAGVFSSEGIFRKEESDWKMAYLCRRVGVQEGKISWNFKISNTFSSIDEVDIIFSHKLFENGLIDLTICNQNTCVPIVDGKCKLKDFSNSTCFTISATLKGGTGELSWQHTQLFRQSLNSDEHPFIVKISLNSQVRIPEVKQSSDKR